MIKSWLDGEIVWLEFEGESLAGELIVETSKWLRENPRSYMGLFQYSANLFF
ncbi:MAG: hypothetical protein HPY45_11955 [Anaerolineae bacterium]|nr:hypothetical protein [Anaerolineae bacterium]